MTGSLIRDGEITRFKFKFNEWSVEGYTEESPWETLKYFLEMLEEGKNERKGV